MTRRERFAAGLVRTTSIALLATVVAIVVADRALAAVADRARTASRNRHPASR